MKLGFSAVVENGRTNSNAAGVTASYDYTRTSVSASLSGSFNSGGWGMVPSLSLSWSEKDTMAHTNSAAVAIAARTERTLKGTAALTGSRTQEVRGKRYNRLTSHFRVAANLYDRQITGAAAQGGTGLEVGGGVVFGYKKGAALSLSGNLSGLGEATRSLSIGTRFDMPF